MTLVAIVGFFNFEGVFFTHLYFSELMPLSNKIPNYLLVTKCDYLNSIFIAEVPDSFVTSETILSDMKIGWFY